MSSLICLVLALLAQQGGVGTVLEADARRTQALLARDFETLETLLADDLTYTHTNAKVDRKTEYLEPFKSGRTRYVTLRPSEVSARLYGDAAILTGRMLSVALVAGAESRTDLRFTSVWIRRDGRWQMVAWHSSRVP